MKTARFLFEKLDGLRSSCVMSVSYNGRALQDEEDVAMLCDAFHLWCLAMWDLAAPFERNRLYDVLPQLFLKLCGCDIALLVRFLDDVRSSFYNLPRRSSLALTVFKGRHLGGTLSSGHVLVPMTALCDRKNGSSSRSLNTLLCFLLKLNIKLDIAEQLEREYVQDEENLASLSLPETICDDLNKIILGWFADFCPSEDWNPRHGPGAVASAGRIPVSHKYRLLGVDEELDDWLGATRIDHSLDYVRPLAPFHRKSEVLFVPKSLKTYRVICKEPATLQYWQQYLASMITDYVHSHAYLSKKINLRDQELSRVFCLQASENCAYATIDLSKASDTVSLALVERIFRDTPLLRGLVATRSNSVLLPSGKEIRTAKFAPMGSALCFPIECIIFAALCELAIAYSSKTHKRYRVYGDDLIIHRDHVSNLMVLLSKCGFLPNREKSYTSSTVSYRESCGMEALDGFDISPVRLSRWFSGLRITRDKDTTRLVDLANSFFNAGMNLARRAVINPLIQLKYPPLFTVPHGIGVWSWSPTNFLSKRKKVGSETWILHGALISKRPPVKVCNEDIRLHEWFRQDGNPDGTVFIERTHVAWQATTSPSWFTMVEV